MGDNLAGLGFSLAHVQKLCSNPDRYWYKIGMKSSTNINSNTKPITIFDLWREFLPLSLSDVTMACGDPLQTTTLAHLPDARNTIAAVGVARSIAIFFESPIIMILHASNALAPRSEERRVGKEC